MRCPIHQVDAFADRVFTGNPAAVVLLEEWPDERLLQSIALENNLSETAFVVPDADGRWRLRWFTPAAEVDLCGHATLAAGFVLLTEGRADSMSGSAKEVAFETASGPLAVRREEDGRFALDLPSRPPRALALHEGPDGLLEALGVEPDAIVELLAARDHVVVLRDEAAVRAVAPDFRRLGAVDVFSAIVTAETGVDRRHEVDFVSRFFGPKVGVDEDPVTGSAHCTLGPLWAERLGRHHLRAEQCSPRGGRLDVRVRSDRVTLVGAVSPYLQGEIIVPARSGRTETARAR